MRVHEHAAAQKEAVQNVKVRAECEARTGENSEVRGGGGAVRRGANTREPDQVMSLAEHMATKCLKDDAVKAHVFFSCLYHVCASLMYPLSVQTQCFHGCRYPFSHMKPSDVQSELWLRQAPAVPELGWRAHAKPRVRQRALHGEWPGCDRGHIHTCMYACMYVCMYVYIYIYIYIYMYIRKAQYIKGCCRRHE